MLSGYFISVMNNFDVNTVSRLESTVMHGCIQNKDWEKSQFFLIQWPMTGKYCNLKVVSAYVITVLAFVISCFFKGWIYSKFKATVACCKKWSSTQTIQLWDIWLFAWYLNWCIVISRECRIMFEKNVAPILNLAGVAVNIIKVLVTQ